MSVAKDQDCQLWAEYVPVAILMQQGLVKIVGVFVFFPPNWMKGAEKMTRNSWQFPC